VTKKQQPKDGCPNDRTTSISISPYNFVVGVYKRYGNLIILSNLCRATSGGYINLGCSREVLFLRGYFQWSMSLRGEDIFAAQER